MICKYKLRCTMKDRYCKECKHNPKAKLQDYFRDRGYVPTCPHEFDDCISDPAYLIYTKYKKLEDFDYDISKGCQGCDDGEWYDDEDK